MRDEEHGSHAPAMAVLALAAIVWTWPLTLHFRDAIPGTPGDNFSFLWNLWWMRHALANHADGFFHATYLFYPFGVDLVNHPHTALQGIVSATLLARASIIEAENLYIIVSVFLNAAAAYALAFDIVRRRRLALLAAVAFGSSPYIAAHLLGHFDLLTAWVIPMFALCWRRALAGEPVPGRRGLPAPLACGVFMAVAAYSAYYYVVYLGLFAVLYALAWGTEGPVDGRSAIVDRPGSRVQSRESATAFTVRLLAVGVLTLDLCVMIWIWLTGGTSVTVLGTEISLHGQQNPLLVIWLSVLVWALARWRVPIIFTRPPAEKIWRGVQAMTIMAAAFAVLSLPLIVQAFRLMMSGRYVTQVYFWRSAPRGVDLLSLFTGNPFHPLVGGVVTRLYEAMGLNRIEQVAWLGVVPIGVLLVGRGNWLNRAEARRWRIVFAGFLVWALGPFLAIAGRDLGLPLPEALARLFPLVDNARVPGRAMVGVYLSLGMLMALRLAGPKTRSAPAFEWALIGCLAVDYLGSPLPLTPLDRPAIYEQLAGVQDESPVIEVPFGVGDGLSAGAGSQDRRILYYATIHGHPLVGGYIGRMPPGAAAAYAAMPVVGNLLRLSSGEPAVEEPAAPAVPFRYLVLDTASASPELVAYLRETLDMDLIGTSAGRELYAVQGVKPPSLRASR
jgi:hypothetical protein